MSDAANACPQTPEGRATAFLAAALAASVQQVTKTHLANLQIALSDIEIAGFELGDLAELLKTLGIPEAEVPTAAVRAVAVGMQVQVKALISAFRAAHAAFAALSGEGARA